MCRKEKEYLLSSSKGRSQGRIWECNVAHGGREGSSRVHSYSSTFMFVSSKTLLLFDESRILRVMLIGLS